MNDDVIYVAILSRDDCANSGLRLKNALNKYSNCKARLITALGPCPAYRMKRDIVLHRNRNRNVAEKIVKEADVIHIKGDEDFIGKKFINLRIPKNKPVIITRSGSMYRKSWKKKYKKDLANTNLRTAFMADLVFPNTDSIFIPHPIDTEIYKPLPLEKRNDRLTICHSPTNKIAKRTGMFIKHCFDVRKVAKADVIYRVDYDKCMQRKSKGHIFYDRIQRGVGSYGNSAIEACALGLATISFISNQSRKAVGEMLDPSVCPIIHADDKTLGNVIKKLVNDKDYREEKMKQSREWCVKYHSSEVVAKQVEELYRKIL